MDRAHMRPPFRLPLPVAGAALMSEVRARLEVPRAPIVGTVLRRHVELTVRPEARSFWSPHLSVDVLEEDGGIILRGRYGPQPEVWTLVMAVYGVLAMVAIAATVFGLSQWNLGWRPWALYGVPVSALLAAGVWVASLAGQRAAYPQMQQLEYFFHDCVRRVSEPPPTTPDRDPGRPGAAVGKGAA